MTDRDKEFARFLTEVLKLFAVLLFGLLGGVFGFTANQTVNEGVRNTFIVCGFLFSIAVGVCIDQLQKNIRKLLRNASFE